METLAILGGVTALVLYGCVRVCTGRRRLFLPDAFILSLTLMFWGAIVVWWQRESVGGSFVLRTTSCSLLGAVVTQSLYLARPEPKFGRLLPPQARRRTENRLCKLAVWGILVANVAVVGILFANATVRSLLISALTNFEPTLISARKTISASTSGYMAPGVIKQVRDILSPIVLAAYVGANRQWARSGVFWTSVSTVALGMILSGQRFPIMILVLSVGISAGRWGSLRIPGAASGIRRFALSATLCVFVFMGITVWLGRTTFDGGLLRFAAVAASGAFDRIVLFAPQETAQTYFFWSELGPTHGRSWLEGLAILLPGAAGHTIYNEIHSLIGGSSEGNGSVLFAADAWLAFGWYGVMFAPSMILAIVNLIDVSLWRFATPLNDGCRIVIFFCLFLVHSPFSFLLYGGLVAVCFAVYNLVMRTAAVPKSNMQWCGRV
jgi:hypothetical protein